MRQYAEGGGELREKFWDLVEFPAIVVLHPGILAQHGSYVGRVAIVTIVDLLDQKAHSARIPFRGTTIMRRTTLMMEGGLSFV
jgi:hypothetical protein